MTLVIAVALTQLLDGATFALAMRDVPLAAEANPIARAVAEAAGLAGVLGYKAVGAALIVALAYRLRHRHALILAVAAVGAVGATMNVLSWVTM